MDETSEGVALPRLPETGIESTSVERVDEPLTLSLVEERLAVAKQRSVTGTVRVSTRTETVDAVAEVELDDYQVEVTRVPVGRVIDEAPVARAEGDVTIIPVIEERLVMVKQLFLKEEIHIRHIVERKTFRDTVALKRQHAVIERTKSDE